MAIELNRTERMLIRLIKEARSHQANQMRCGVDELGATNSDSGLEWLEFVIKNGELRARIIEDLDKDLMAKKSHL